METASKIEWMEVVDKYDVLSVIVVVEEWYIVFIVEYHSYG